MEQITLETKMDIFKWKQYESAIILLTVRWYLKYSLSYRDIVEMMNERGLAISHTTIMEGTEKGRVFYTPDMILLCFPTNG
jgi:transposase-like protein